MLSRGLILDELGEPLLEVETRVGLQHPLYVGDGQLVVSMTAHVEPRRVPEQVGLGTVVEADVDRHMQSDCFGEALAALYLPLVLLSQTSGRIRAVLLEAPARIELLDEADVVEERGDIEQLLVEADAVAVRERDREEVAPEAVVDEERRRHGTQEILRLLGDARVGADAENVGHGRRVRAGVSSRRMLASLLIRWAVLGVAFAFTSWLLSGMNVAGGFWAYVWVSAIFGVVNAVIGTILRILTFPLTLLTLGLFSVIVNAILLEITDGLTDHLSIDSFWWTAILAAIVISIVSMILDAMLDAVMRPRPAASY